MYQCLVKYFVLKQKPAYEMRISDWSSDVCSSDLFAQAQLLTAKPVLYVCNVDEGGAAEGNEHSARVFDKAAKEGARAVIVSAAIEAEIVTMPAEDRAEFLADLGLQETGLTRIIRAGYDLLELIKIGKASCRERVCTYV